MNIENILIDTLDKENLDKESLGKENLNKENLDKENLDNENLDKDIDDICLIKNLSIKNDIENNIKNGLTDNIIPNIKENLFDKIKYFENLDVLICNILSRHENNILTYDILDTEKTTHIKLITLKEKQRQMKIGEIWQEVLGNYEGYTNLKSGHESGLDIISHNKKIAIELKNRTNTDNSSSKKYNFNKLLEFKKKNLEYTCIYANINADTEKKTLKGMIKNIKHNGIEIQHHVGYMFLKFILGNDVDVIIDFVKNTIDKYTESK